MLFSVKLTVAPLRGYPRSVTCAYKGSWPEPVTWVAFFAVNVIEDVVEIRGSTWALYVPEKV